MSLPCSSNTGSSSSTEPVACCPQAPSQPEASRPRRRKVMLGGGLLVLCCCSLATLALAGRPQHLMQQPRRTALAAPPVCGFVRPTGVARRSTSRLGQRQQLQQQQQLQRQPMAAASPSALWVSYTGATGTPPPPAPAGSPSNEASSTMPLPPSQSAARPSPVPRPANLPGLSKEDLILLRAGQRVQHQIRNGCMGSGYAVVDVMADSKTVWETLLNFERYAEMVPTIRKVRVTGRPWPGLTKGLFTLSKFRFRLSVVHKHRPEENRLDFFLDPDSPSYRSILEMAEGFWFVDPNPADRPPGWTRVYMTATVKVNSLVPVWLVEYAAERALKRATAWLKPYVEQRTWEKQERLRRQRQQDQQQPQR